MRIRAVALLAWAAAAVATTGAVAAPAHADTPQSKVSSNESGVRVEIDRRGHGGGGGAGAGATPARRRTATRRPACRLLRVPASRNLTPRFRAGNPPVPLTPFVVVCYGRVTGFVWLDRTRDRRASAASVSEQLVHDITLPVGAVRMSPARRGLTGLETWFWIDAFNAEPIAATVRALGATVEVEATPTGYEWDFGDGTAVAGDAGRRAPQRSTVTHVYEDASNEDGFTVDVGFVYAIRYRIDGGSWVPLPPVTRHATRTYPVVEVRGQLTAQP